MSEISDLENRISAAMDRIGRGLETVANAPVSGGEAGEDAERLERALEDEKLAGAQLEERVRALSERVETLETELSSANAATEAAQGALAEVEAARDAAQSAQAEAETQRDAAETQREAAEAQRDAAESAKADAESGLAAAQSAAAEVVPAASDADIAASRVAMDELTQRLRRMRRLSRNIRENNQKLREAAEKGVTDPALINASLRSELETVNALRETDALETDAILSG
ncbi:MAG: hypothetical protein ABJJ01_07485, partial [Marinomonas sp.]